MDDLRRLQLCELEILKAVVEVCDRHNLKYWLVYGTLLGAVRHHGFIPWDDDMDLAMELKDLARFEKYARKELSSQYFVQTPRSERRGRWLFCKIRKEGTLCLQKEEKRAPYLHQGIWIDIFPIIDLSNNMRVKNAQISILQALQRSKLNHIEIQKKFSIKNTLKLAYELFLRVYESILWRVLLALGYIKKKGTGECYLIGTNWINLQQPERFTFKREYFSGDMKKYQFEDAEFTSMENAHDYLSAFYGDYMTPKRYTHIGDFPNIVFDMDGINTE